MKTDMTVGSPIRHIVVFMVPLLIGNMFQQFYNMVDTVIVGRYLGVDSLAAVGSSGSLVFLINGFAIGLTAGFSIIISQHYGAASYDSVKRDFMAAIVMGITGTMVLTVISMIYSKRMLMLIRTPAGILEEADQYLKVIYGGMIATMLFNLLSNAMRAIGDSRMPLVFLVISCVANVILDILFISTFGMGVTGAALATVLAQLLSVVCCMIHIAKRIEVLHPVRESFLFDRRDVVKQIKMGGSMGFQSSIISIGGILVQISLNQLGAIYVASYTVASKIESIVHMPLISFGLTMATYIGQNYGANDIGRIRKGVRQCLALSVTFSLVTGVALILFGYHLVGIFVPGETAMMENAQIFLNVSGGLLFVLAILYVIRYSLQGLGQSMIPTVAGIMELIMRATAALVMSENWGFTGICWANPLAWIGACIPLCIAYVVTIRNMIYSQKNLCEIDTKKRERRRSNMNSTVKVDVGGKRGYKVRTKIKNKDFVSIMQEYTVDNDGITFRAETYLDNEATVRISFASQTVYRVELYPFHHMEVRKNPVFEFPVFREFQVSEDELFVYICTEKLKIAIRKCPWEVSVSLDGSPVTAEHIQDFNVDQKYKAMPLGFEYDLVTKEIKNTYDTYYMHVDEGFYGFGEKFTEFNKRGQRVEVWQRDALSTNSDWSYKGMPYFMSSYGYSVLLNTFTRTSFDMGATSEVSYTMYSEDPYLDYYVFCNRSYKGLIQDYTALSGRSEMVPKWSFGFWMSKMSYRTRDEVESVVKRAAEFGMSMDVIHIDGWQGKEFLEFDEERFPNPKEMIQKLNENGVQLSCWMFPYVPKYYHWGEGDANPAFQAMGEMGYLVKNSKGGTCEFVPAEGEGDGGGATMAAIDLTNPEAVEYVKDKIRKLMEMGVGVMKTDFSEEIPETAVFYDGTTGKETHNKYPLLYAKTIYEASREVKEKQGLKALLWGRSGFAGSQNYPANWAGDSSTHKNNLAAILRGGLSMGISGVSFWGFDIGGFYNCDYEGKRTKPSNEEYVRSVQMGLLAPLSRSHGQATPREPWEYSKEAQAAFLKINKFRYRLFPYLYSLAMETHNKGIPMMRAMLLEFQEDLNTREIFTQYMLGNALLVAPVFDQQTQYVYLPIGSWVDWNTKNRVDGGTWVAENCPLDTLPLYFKEDTALPLLNQAGLHSPENFFEDITMYLNLVHGIRCEFYDDGKAYTFEAIIEKGTAMIQTDLVCTGYMIYTLEEIKKAMINGKEYPVKKEKGGFLI